MGWNGNYMSLPVGMGDISNAVNYSSLDLGTLIESGSINKWAKFKPVRYNSWGILTDAQRASVNYGLSAPTYRNSAAGTLADEWEYLRPRGIGNNEPFRMLDFDGYFSDASQPVTPPGPVIVDYTPTASIDFSNYIPYNPEGDNIISWNDLQTISGYYLCVVFAKNSSLSGTVMWKTSAQTFASGASMRLPITNGELLTIRDLGYTYYYLCACSVSKTSFDDAAPADARFMALPCNSTASLLDTFTVRTATFRNIAIVSLNVSRSPSAASQFADASQYTGIFPVVEDLDEVYYPCSPVNGYYYLHLGIEIEAADMAYTVSGASFSLRPNFAGNGFSSSYAQAATLRDSSFAVQQQIVIPANETRTVYFTFSAPLLSLDATGTAVSGLSTGQYVSANLTLIHNGNSVNIGELRVRN